MHGLEGRSRFQSELLSLYYREKKRMQKRGGHFARPAFFVSCATTKGRDSRRSQRGYSLCSRRGQFPLRGKGKESLAQSPLPLRPPPETWGTPPYTVMAIRFPALMGRQSCHFLESTSLYPPPAALWCFHLWNPLPETRDGAGKTNPQGDEGRETRIKQKTDRVVRSEAERTGVEIRRFSFAPRCAVPIGVGTHWFEILV